MGEAAWWSSARLRVRQVFAGVLTGAGEPDKEVELDKGDVGLFTLVGGRMGDSVDGEGELTGEGEPVLDPPTVAKRSVCAPFMNP